MSSIIKNRIQSTSLVEHMLINNNPPDPEEFHLTYRDFTKLFWKFKGLQKEITRNNAFWAATNENFKIAYEKLDEQEKELAIIYSRLQEDLQVASQIQQSMLPKVYKKMEQELDIAIYHKQFNQVGGDYYDFFQTKSGDYAIGIFDIAGHGISAALIMTYLKAQLMGAIEKHNSPKSIIENVNNLSLAFLRNIKKYATVNFVLFKKYKISYVNGGGNGLLIQKENNIDFIKKDNFLGLRNKAFHEYDLDFFMNDLLIMYTDGFSESQDKTGNDYTKKRLHQLIFKNKNKPVNEILEICVSDLDNNCYLPHDDITLIILRKKE